LRSLSAKTLIMKSGIEYESKFPSHKMFRIGMMKIKMAYHLPIIFLDYRKEIITL